jgi:seryl-tRNA synthetase
MKKRTSIQCITLIACALIMIPISDTSAQLNYTDSLRIENERSILLAQFANLRDSIKQTIALIDQASKKSSPKTAEKLNSLAKELDQNREQLDRISNELSTTSQKGWSEADVKRIRLLEKAIRGHYKTEKKVYARLVKPKKRAS